MWKVAFQKSDVIIFGRFLPLHSQKNRDITLNVCMRSVCMQLRNTFSCFWPTFKFWIFICDYFEKWNFVFWEKKTKIKIENNFTQRSILRLLAFYVAFYLKNVHPRSLEKLAVFWRKIAKHDVTKKTFSQMSLTDFPETMKEDFKVILACVLKVLRGYQPLFFLAIEKIREREHLPPPLLPAPLG